LGALPALSERAKISGATDWKMGNLKPAPPLTTRNSLQEVTNTHMISLGNLNLMFFANKSPYQSAKFAAQIKIVSK